MNGKDHIKDWSKDVLNAWNLWKRAHKGQGLSASERSARYKREKLSLCESEVPQELANAGAGRTSAATPVGGGSHDDVAQRVIPRSLSGDPLGSGIQSPAKPKDIDRFCHHRLLLAGMLDPYTQVLDVAVNGLLLWRRSTGEALEIWDSSRLVHATDQVNYVISTTWVPGRDCCGCKWSSELTGWEVQLQPCPMPGCSCVTCAKHLGPERVRELPSIARQVCHCCREISASYPYAADDRPPFLMTESSDDINSGGSEGSGP